MNNALISPNETVYSYDGTLLGERIAETLQTPFPVAPPLYWIECADEVNASEWYFQTETQSCQPIPVNPENIVTDEQKLSLVRYERNLRLVASDWTQMADVIASHDAAWLNAWNTYRQELRDLPATVDLSNLDSIVWPVPPSA